MSDVGWEIHGPGIQRVIQEAVRKGKNTVFVYDQDPTGRILRVGYIHVDPGTRIDEISDVTWIDWGEIECRKGAIARTVMHSQLDVAFTQPDKSHVYTLIQLPSRQQAGARLRSLVREHRTGSAGFVIQVEIREGETGDWVAAIRYDCAHGEMHRDMIPKDRKPYKIKLENQQGEKAIKQAFVELKARSSGWLYQLGYLSAPHFHDDAEAKRTIEGAERQLLRLWEDPSALQKESSHFIQFKDKPDMLKRIEYSNGS